MRRWPIKLSTRAHGMMPKLHLFFIVKYAKRLDDGTAVWTPLGVTVSDQDRTAAVTPAGATTSAAKKRTIVHPNVDVKTSALGTRHVQVLNVLPPICFKIFSLIG